MKVLAINGSPHMDEGNTALILNPFLEGMKEVGAEVELFYTRKLDVKPCNGDMSCWLKNPGECIIKDDMQALYPKFREADVMVYATPVYYAGMSGPMKNLMDRLLPLHLPGQERDKKQSTVLVSTCGFWKLDMFEPLLAQMKAISQGEEEDPKAVFAGALLRPHADCMRELMKTKEGRALTDEVVEASKEVGRQMAKYGRMSEDTLKGVSAELMPQEAYDEAAQELFEQICESMKR